MTAQSAIHELKQVRQYCSARAIPAIDYAIQVLQGLAEREKRVEEAKQANPQSPPGSGGGLPGLSPGHHKTAEPHPFGWGSIFLSKKERKSRISA